MRVLCAYNTATDTDALGNLEQFIRRYRESFDGQQDSSNNMLVTWRLNRSFTHLISCPRNMLILVRIAFR